MLRLGEKHTGMLRVKELIQIQGFTLNPKPETLEFRVYGGWNSSD